MKFIVHLSVALMTALIGVAVSPSLFAQEETRALPTLLIKGEVVSVDSADPNAPVLKVKDRYGFETPILLTQETKISQADQPLTTADLTPGAAVEVEYNFDVNTAKRHAVVVKVIPPATTASSAAPEATASPSASAESQPAATSSQAAPAAPVAASATHEHPGKEHPGETTQ